ncbi:FtsB family cell division protein [Paradevosia shaoguanensis]|uniref:Septum formation initiator family protein n=1 Tax=Paradevosia shaoguanensis TaxID=1335043 RepID=A0AA41QLR3_9HYPH|nr:septum formation initiator family protein [Paradevosia shaoguanensis]MCF1742436.1 septum formation initiator family protein [Paradevosia shaoguanensis]MCI0126919.1 septum formation initiator family protein [Paradevosia shaoguanensis]
MPTRLKRPAFWRPLAVTVALVGFQGYLGYSALNGQFGTLSQEQMKADIEELKAESSVLQAEIDSYRHRASLFDASRLDPDILTEQARALLSMARPEDIVVMVDESGKPVLGSSSKLAEQQLTNLIQGNSGR